MLRWFFAFFGASLLASSVSGGGLRVVEKSCSFNSDCLCPNCLCVNAHCQCDRLFAGNNCETKLFCSDRSDCHHNGDCVGGSTCRCDAGWDGRYCEICELQCGHGGLHDKACVRCEDCGGGYNSRTPAGVPFYAFSDERASFPTVAIDRWTCKSEQNSKNHVYRRADDSAQPPTVAGGICTGKVQSVFHALAIECSAHVHFGSIPVYEHESISTGNFIYSHASEAPPGYKASTSLPPSAGGVAFFTPKKEESGALPVYASHVQLLTPDGRIDDTFYSLNPREDQECRYFDVEVDIADIISDLARLKEESYARMVDSWLDVNPLTNPNSLLRVAIGGGVDGSRGTLKNIPVVEMTYDDEPDPNDQSRVWNGIAAPSNVRLTKIEGLVDTTTWAFPTISDFVDGATEHKLNRMFEHNSSTQHEHGVVGKMEVPWEQMLSNDYNAEDDHSLTITQAPFAVVAAMFRSEHEAKMGGTSGLSITSSHLRLDTFVKQAMNLLPPDATYSSSCWRVWETFFDTWGSGFVDTTSYGGTLELTTEWPSSMINRFGGEFTADQLVDFAEYEFERETEIDLENSQGTQPPVEYVNARELKKRCYGGSSSYPCFSSFQLWNFSLQHGSSPAVVSFTYRSLNELVAQEDWGLDSTTFRRTFAKASHRWLESRRAAWDAIDKCPPCACGGCASGSDFCTCHSFQSKHMNGAQERTTPNPNGRLCRSQSDDQAVCLQISPVQFSISSPDLNCETPLSTNLPPLHPLKLRMERNQSIIIGYGADGGDFGSNPSFCRRHADGSLQFVDPICGDGPRVVQGCSVSTGRSGSNGEKLCCPGEPIELANRCCFKPLTTDRTATKLH